MKKYTLTPRTLAVYEEWLTTKGKFGPDVHGHYNGLKIWCVMEQLEHENIVLRGLLVDVLTKLPHDD
jgi:hypothetical protein